MVKIPVGNRKVQKATNRSYFLNLPLWWVKQNGLEKGDKIEIYRSKAGSLILKPNYEFQDKPAVIQVEPSEEMESGEILSRLNQIVSK